MDNHPKATQKTALKAIPFFALGLSPTPSLRSNHPLLDPKLTLARYRTTCYSTPNTPLLDIEPPDPRPQTHPCSTSNTPLLDVELPVTRPQTYPCSMSNYPLLDLKHTLARCRTSRSRPQFEPSPSSSIRLKWLTISHLNPKPLILPRISHLPVSLSPCLLVSLSPRPPPLHPRHLPSPHSRLSPVCLGLFRSGWTLPFHGEREIS